MDADVPKTTSAAQANEISWEKRFVDKRHGGDNSKRAVEELFWQDITGIASSLLPKINKSGSVSKEELSKSIVSGTLHGEEAQVGAALYDNFGFVKNKEFRFGIARISSADVFAFARKSADAERVFHRVDDLTYWADDCGNLKRLSGNKAGSLSMIDLVKAQKLASLSVEDRAMLAELKANFNSISRNGKIGPNEIDAYFKINKKNPDLISSKAFQNDMSLVEKNQQNQLAHKLFANEKDPLKSIKAISVKQGFSGDCGFKAALAGLAEMRPQDVFGMIKAHGSVFEVSLPGSKDKSLLVSKPTDEELALFSNEENADGFWPALLAKSYGESVFKRANAIDKARMSSKTPDEWAGEDANEAHAIQALTGHEAERVYLADQSDRDLTKQLLDGQKDKRVMVLATANAEGKTPDGFSHGHAFTVLNVSNAVGEPRVTIRDPRDFGKNRTDGTMSISLQTLKRNFRSIYIETKKNL